MNDEVKAQTFVDRMVDELNALEDKIAKLQAFISTATFDGLPDEEQIMLTAQRSSMRLYASDLKDRLEYYVSKGTPV
jgi:hypothetical protein